MCYWLLPVSDVPISDTTVQHVRRDDLVDNDTKARVGAFNKQLEVSLDVKNFLLIPGSETMLK